MSASQPVNSELGDTWHSHICVEEKPTSHATTGTQLGTPAYYPSRRLLAQQ